MNQYSTDKIKELNAVSLVQAKEWGKTNFTNKLKGRQIYWTWTQKIHTFKYICPMTLRVWFNDNFNGYKNDTNAISEMYLLPK